VVALQEEATNHPKVRWSRAVRAERWGKRRTDECVRYDPMKAKTNEPQETCRKLLDDIETRSGDEACNKPGGYLFTAQAVSGIYAARAWVRLLYGTWEPVVSREGRLMVTDLRLSLPRKATSGRNRKEPCPHARHRGGPPGSSDEGPVIGLERSGRAIQATLTVNHEACGRTR
jgi:hypothetical protein